jgi:hypothetical protein
MNKKTVIEIALLALLILAFAVPVGSLATSRCYQHYLNTF